MRVVARYACDPGITISPASTLFKAIGGQTYNAHRFFGGLENVPPCAMARATKIHRAGGVQGCRIEYHSGISSWVCVSNGDVSGTRPMASFTGNASYCRFRTELPIGNRRRRVTPEALRQLLVGDSPP